MSSLTPGRKLGPYVIESVIGAGGMGEVYQARDTRLDRVVAIKVIPAALAASPDARARFEREAKVISSLNHPHICTLHDVGHDNGLDYLVMERLEGESLAKRLERGPLPVTDTLRIGSQVADALDRAHRQGIVHRDLKPDNVMLTKSGAKLLDFGLARGSAAFASSDPRMTSTPTVTSALTAEGSIIGTLAYMAPEQLEGKEADPRTDIWGLGVLLYEMLSARRAFQAPSQAGLIASILDREPPPLASLAPSAPPALLRLVERCLAKDPDERRQSARDVMHELREMGSSSGISGVTTASSGSMPAPVIRKSWMRRPFAIGLAVAGFLGLVVAIHFYRLATLRGDRPTTTPLARFELVPVPGPTAANPSEPAVSPDGRIVAFGGVDSAGKQALYLRPLDSPEVRRIAGTENAAHPFWSPNGQWLAFFAAGKLRKTRFDGSSPVVVADAPDDRGGAWSRSDILVFAPQRQGGLVAVPAAGGTPRPVTTLEPGSDELGHRYPTFLPDGRHFVYISIHRGGDRILKVGDVDAKTNEKLGPLPSAPVYADPGYIVYFDKASNIVARPFDAGRRKFTGDPVTLVQDAWSSNIAYANAGIGGGVLTFETARDQAVRLAWWDPDRIQSEYVTTIVNPGELSLSPDGRQLAFTRESKNNFDIWIDDLAGHARRLTFDGNYKTTLTWSPDQRSLAWSVQPTQAQYEFHVKAVDGGGSERTVFRPTGLLNYLGGWTNDGKTLLATCSDSTGIFQLWTIPLDGGEARIYHPTAAGRESCSLSPDGRWLAYISTDTGTPEAFIETFPDPAARYQVSAGLTFNVAWMDQGRSLILVDSDSRLLEVQIGPGIPPSISSPRFLLNTGGAGSSGTVDPSSRRLLGPETATRNEAHVIEAMVGWERLVRGRGK